MEGDGDGDCVWSIVKQGCECEMRTAWARGNYSGVGFEVAGKWRAPWPDPPCPRARVPVCPEPAE